jgi:hypothetical protein
MLPTRQLARGYGVAGMEVGPVRRDVEPAGFGGGQGVFVGLGGGAGRIQFHQMILISNTPSI